MQLTDEQLTDLVVGQHNERLKFVAREAVHELKQWRSIAKRDHGKPSAIEGEDSAVLCTQLSLARDALAASLAEAEKAQQRNNEEIARVQKQRDEARQEVERLAEVCRKWETHFTETPGVAAANAEIVALKREMERWRHGVQIEGDYVCPNELRMDKAIARNRDLEDALQKISDIRDSIVGLQGFNFSEHAYPLVAVLDAVGYKGKGYEIASENLGTLIEQRAAAQAAADKFRSENVLLKARIAELDESLATRAEVERLRAELEHQRKARAIESVGAAANRDYIDTLTAERDALKAENRSLQAKVAGHIYNAKIHQETFYKTEQERDSLAAQLQAEAGRMRPVYEAAVEWARTIDFAATRSPGEMFTCEVKLFETVRQTLPAEPASLVAIVEQAAKRFDGRPVYRASIEARRELDSALPPTPQEGEVK